MTTTTRMSRVGGLVVMALVLGVGACGGEGLPMGDEPPPSAGAAAAAAEVTPMPPPSMLGVWVSETTGEVIDLRDGGIYHHVSAEGIPNDGTWSVVDGYLTTVVGGTGRQRIDGLTADRLTLAPGGVYDRATAALIEGCWVSAATGANLALLPGAFALVLSNGETSKGTWTSDGGTYLTFSFPSGAPQATWRLSITTTSLTLSSGDGVATSTGAGLTTWAFVRSPAADCGAARLPACAQMVTGYDNCADPPGSLCCLTCSYGDHAGELRGCTGVLPSGTTITCAAAAADCPR